MNRSQFLVEQCKAMYTAGKRDITPETVYQWVQRYNGDNPYEIVFDDCKALLTLDESNPEARKELHFSIIQHSWDMEDEGLEVSPQTLHEYIASQHPSASYKCSVEECRAATTEYDLDENDKRRA